MPVLAHVMQGMERTLLKHNPWPCVYNLVDAQDNRDADGDALHRPRALRSSVRLVPPLSARGATSLRSVLVRERRHE